MSLFNRPAHNKRRQWGAAISEYLPVVTLIAGALITSFGQFGDTVRENTSDTAVALAGGYVSPSGSGQSGGSGSTGNGGGAGGSGGLGGSKSGAGGFGSGAGSGGASSGGGSNAGAGSGASAGSGMGITGGGAGGGAGDSESSGDSESGSGGTAIVDLAASGDESLGGDESMGAVEYATEFAKGAIEGLVTQGTDLLEMIFNPGETIGALVDLAKALKDDPMGTLAAIKDEMAEELAAVIHGGPHEAGRVVGENLSPAVALKVLSRLKRFGEVADTVGDVNKHTDGDPTAPPKKRDEGCSSFLAGTQVWTPGGMLPIEGLNKGDIVFTRSDIAFTDHRNKITQLLRREAEGYFEILAGTETIKVTAEHPFWRQGSGWTEAKDLQPGDPVAAAAGDVVVRSSKYIKGPVSVYNFSVEVNHNYFVSPHKLWVHNANDIACNLTPKFAGRSDAFNAAKKDLGIPRSQEPDSVRRVYMKDRNGENVIGENGQPIVTREYIYTRPDGSKVIIQEHSAGHNFNEGGVGDQGPHFNVRPMENPRTGKVPGTLDHYSWEE